jgi:hypothetical protein
MTKCFQPTITIDNDMHDRLYSGDVTLRPGQWVKLAWNTRNARYVGITPHKTFVIQHYDSEGYSQKKFVALLDYWRCFHQKNDC